MDWRATRARFPPHDAAAEGPVVFLAGPIQGTADWQTVATGLILDDPDLGHVTVANPRTTPNADGKTPNADFHFESQVDWESRWLRRAADLDNPNRRAR